MHCEKTKLNSEFYRSDLDCNLYAHQMWCAVAEIHPQKCSKTKNEVDTKRWWAGPDGPKREN